MGIEISEFSFWPFDEPTAEEKMKAKIESEGLLPIKLDTPDASPQAIAKAEKKAVAQYVAEGKPLPKIYAEQVKKGKGKGKGKGKSAIKIIPAAPEPTPVPPEPTPVPVFSVTGPNWTKIGIIGGGVSLLAIGAYFLATKEKE